MDALITAAAQALAAGDPLGAMTRVALREDAPALALRGLAMAQLGDFTRATLLLRRAARAFGPREATARARCVVAEAEIALASRELAGATATLDAARATLDAHGDHVNAAHARYLGIRRLLLLGRLDETEQALAAVAGTPLPPALLAVHELVAAGVAMRRLRATAARDALARAARAAQRAGIPALMAEVDAATRTLHAPAARWLASGEERLLQLRDVEALLASETFVVDACRHAVRHRGKTVPLASRPVLFALMRQLAEAWPHDVPRDALVARAFRARHADESYRARLRVELGRLRRALSGLAEVHATPHGYALLAHRADQVGVLAWPVESAHAAVLALLGDGESWSSSALALALGRSQRSVQRALETLAAAGSVQCSGHGRARRWMTPLAPGFATTLLLPAPLSFE